MKRELTIMQSFWVQAVRHLRGTRFDSWVEDADERMEALREWAEDRWGEGEAEELDLLAER